MRTAPLLLAALTLLATTGAPARAQGRPRAAEDLHNLGALGLAVDPAGDALVVRKVLPGSPAGAAGVREGDELVKVGGDGLAAATAVMQVIGEVEKAEAARKKAPVVLVVRRGGAEQTIEVDVPRLGAHVRACPEKCKKCDQIIEAGLAFLARQQQPDGRFPTDLGGKTGNVVVTSLGGLAFLAAGAGFEPGGPLDRATTYVMNNVGPAGPSPLSRGGGGGNWNQENWELSYGLMFLAEVARKTRRPDVKAKCAELVKLLEKNQEQSGGWAHGPGGPNALNYLELQIMSNYALLGMGAAKKLGLEVDMSRLERALGWVEGTASNDGGVGYSHRQGQKGFGHPGRTAGAIVAFASLGQTRHPFFGRMVGYLERNLGRLPEGHVSPAMHLLAGAMASRLLGRGWDAYMEAYRPLIMSFRRPDGSFSATPTRESRSLGSNTDITVGPSWTTATYVLILSLPRNKLPLLLGGDDDGGDRGPRRGPRTGT
ncbi:MAG: PDZ domain-containing protein [Planctomycetes bacterium]|nr:PDZ domain-containing protein [Planctomycetota bacterium]